MVENKKTNESGTPKPKAKAEEKEKDVKDVAGVELSFLEADDDFEEFPAEEYKADEPEPDADIWQDDWDDDNIEEDFANQLRNEYQKRDLTTK